MLNEEFLFKIAGSMLGLPPEKAREHFKALQDWNVSAITGFDARIKRLEANQAEIIRLLLKLVGEEENGRREHARAIESRTSGIAVIADCERGS